MVKVLQYMLGAALTLFVACDAILGIERTTPAAERPVVGGAAGGEGGSPEAGHDAGGQAGASVSSGGESGTRTTGGAGTTSDGGEAGAGAASTGGANGSGGTPARGGAAGRTPDGGESGDDGGAAGDGGGAGGGAGADGDDWTPAALPNLVLWLEPAQVQMDGSGVTAWLDRSPHAHSAVQALEGRRPVFSPTALAGLPGVQFDGENDLLEVADHFSLRFGANTSFVVEAVFSHTTPLSASVSGNLVLSKQSAESPYPGVALVANRPIRGMFTTRLAVQLDFFATAVTPDGPYNDGLPMVMGLVRTTPADFELRLNGAVIDRGPVTGYPIDVSASGYALLLGGGQTEGVQGLQGVISEIVCAQDVTANDVRKLETYLTRKYAEAISSP